MKKEKSFLIQIIILVILMNFLSIVYSRDIPFTQDDRDRLVRLEEGQKNLLIRLEEGQKNLLVRFEEGQKNLQKQIDDLRSFMLWGFGITFAGIFSLIAFVLWDRRTALRPAIIEIEDLKRKESLLEEALRKIAFQDEKVAGVLKTLGIL